MSESKLSNPKDAVGTTKVPFTALSFPVIAELAVGMTEGTLKYGKYNYREIGVRSSIYIDAAMRHLTAFWEGEDIDPDSGMSHIVKAMSSLMVLRDAMIRNMVTDDRPTGTLGFIKALNKKVEALVEKYPEPAEPFFASRDPDVYNGGYHE